VTRQGQAWPGIGGRLDSAAEVGDTT
jgi:hypothetical protein